MKLKDFFKKNIWKLTIASSITVISVLAITIPLTVKKDNSFKISSFPNTREGNMNKILLYLQNDYNEWDFRSYIKVKDKNGELSNYQKNNITVVEASEKKMFSLEMPIFDQNIMNNKYGIFIKNEIIGYPEKSDTTRARAIITFFAGEGKSYAEYPVEVESVYDGNNFKPMKVQHIIDSKSEIINEQQNINKYFSLVGDVDLDVANKQRSKTDISKVTKEDLVFDDFDHLLDNSSNIQNVNVVIDRISYSAISENPEEIKIYYIISGFDPLSGITYSKNMEGYLSGFLVSPDVLTGETIVKNYIEKNKDTLSTLGNQFIFNKPEGFVDNTQTVIDANNKQLFSSNFTTNLVNSAKNEGVEILFDYSNEGIDNPCVFPSPTDSSIPWYRIKIRSINSFIDNAYEEEFIVENINKIPGVNFSITEQQKDIDFYSEILTSNDLLLVDIFDVSITLNQSIFGTGIDKSKILSHFLIKDNEIYKDSFTSTLTKTTKYNELLAKISTAEKSKFETLTNNLITSFDNNSINKFDPKDGYLDSSLMIGLGSKGKDFYYGDISFGEIITGFDKNINFYNSRIEQMATLIKGDNNLIQIQTNNASNEPDISNFKELWESGPEKIKEYFNSNVFISPELLNQISLIEFTTIPKITINMEELVKDSSLDPATNKITFSLNIEYGTMSENNKIILIK